MMISITLQFITAIALLSFTIVHSYIPQPYSTSTYYPTTPNALYFSGAGIYFWWQLGAAKYMKENCDLEALRKYPTIGASAGSITSTLLLSEANFDDLPMNAIEIALKFQVLDRKTGLAGMLGQILREWLEKSIPDMDEMPENALVNLHIALTPLFGPPKTVSNFKDKNDLINAIMASCHVPVFLDGAAYTSYKNEPVIDGSFWYFVSKNRFDLPMPERIKNKKESIYWIDYCDDEDFMASISGNFLEMIRPDDIPTMVDAGYNHFKRLHQLENKVPHLKFPLSKFIPKSTISKYINFNRPQIKVPF